MQHTEVLTVEISNDGGEIWDTALNNVDLRTGFVGTDTLFFYNYTSSSIYASFDGGSFFSIPYRN